MSFSYLLGKLGESGILLGPTETVIRLTASGRYTGPEQIDEGVGVLTGGLGAWHASKYMDERQRGIRRSPLVHLGRAMEFGGTATTEVILQTGAVDNVFRAFAPAGIGIPVGAFFEYVAGPVHERFSKRYGKAATELL